jgi:hypothetical protein
LSDSGTLPIYKILNDNVYWGEGFRSLMRGVKRVVTRRSLKRRLSSLPIPLAVSEVSALTKKRLPWVLMWTAFVLSLVWVWKHLGG